MMAHGVLQVQVAQSVNLKLLMPGVAFCSSSSYNCTTPDATLSTRFAHHELEAPPLRPPDEVDSQALGATVQTLLVVPGSAGSIQSPVLPALAVHAHGPAQGHPHDELDPLWGGPPLERRRSDDVTTSTEDADSTLGADVDDQRLGFRVGSVRWQLELARASGLPVPRSVSESGGPTDVQANSDPRASLRPPRRARRCLAATHRILVACTRVIPLPLRQLAALACTVVAQEARAQAAAARDALRVRAARARLGLQSFLDACTALRLRLFTPGPRRVGPRAAAVSPLSEAIVPLS
jgi:hypothetical protein